MNSDNKNTIIGLAAVIIIAIGALVFFMTRQGPSTSDAITENTSAMKKQAPAGLGELPPEKALEGAVLMGGKRGGTAPVVPPPSGN